MSQCKTHFDCRDTEQCHSGSCIDACRVEQCGTNAICTSRDHSAYCTCPQGYSGDANVACYPSEFYVKMRQISLNKTGLRNVSDMKISPDY